MKYKITHLILTTFVLVMLSFINVKGNTSALMIDNTGTVQNTNNPIIFPNNIQANNLLTNVDMVRNFGAIPDGVRLRYVTIATGDTNLSVQNAAFSLSSVGKIVCLQLCGANTNNFTTTCYSYVNPSNIVLSAPVPQGVTNSTSNFPVSPQNPFAYTSEGGWIGSDNTAQFQAALNQITNGISISIHVPNGIYLINGPVQGTNVSQLYLPPVAPRTIVAPVFKLYGDDIPTLNQRTISNQVTTIVSGATIVSTVPVLTNGLGVCGSFIDCRNFVSPVYNAGLDFNCPLIDLEKLRFEACFDNDGVMLNVAGAWNCVLNNIDIDSGYVNYCNPQPQQTNTWGLYLEIPSSDGTVLLEGSVIIDGFYNGSDFGEHTVLAGNWFIGDCYNAFSTALFYPGQPFGGISSLPSALLSVDSEHNKNYIQNSIGQIGNIDINFLHVENSFTNDWTWPPVLMNDPNGGLGGYLYYSPSFLLSSLGSSLSGFIVNGANVEIHQYGSYLSPNFNNYLNATKVSATTIIGNSEIIYGNNSLPFELLVTNGDATIGAAQIYYATSLNPNTYWYAGKYPNSDSLTPSAFFWTVSTNAGASNSRLMNLNTNGDLSIIGKYNGSGAGLTNNVYPDKFANITTISPTLYNALYNQWYYNTNTAFISPTGNDSTGTVGNPSLPFLTESAAETAVTSGANGCIFALGSGATYTIASSHTVLKSPLTFMLFSNTITSAGTSYSSKALNFDAGTNTIYGGTFSNIDIKVTVSGIGLNIGFSTIINSFTNSSGTAGFDIIGNNISMNNCLICSSNTTSVYVNNSTIKDCFIINQNTNSTALSSGVLIRSGGNDTISDTVIFVYNPLGNIAACVNDAVGLPIQLSDCWLVCPTNNNAGTNTQVWVSGAGSSVYCFNMLFPPYISDGIGTVQFGTEPPVNGTALTNIPGPTAITSPIIPQTGYGYSIVTDPNETNTTWWNNTNWATINDYNTPTTLTNDSRVALYSSYVTNGLAFGFLPVAQGWCRLIGSTDQNIMIRTIVFGNQLVYETTGNQLWLESDGSPENYVYNGGGGTPTYLIITWPTFGLHETQLHCVENGPAQGICAVYWPITNALINVPQPKTTAIIVGDSYSISGDGINGWYEWVFQLQQKLIANGINLIDQSEGGTGYTANGANTNFLARVTNDIAAFNPNYVIWAGGENDTGSSTNALYTACTNCFFAVTNISPKTKQLVINYWGSSLGASTLSGNTWVSVDISNAAAAYGLPVISPAYSTNSNPWFTGAYNVPNSGNTPLFYTPTGIHPSIIGHTFLADMLVDWCLTNMIPASVNYGEGNSLVPVVY